MGLEMRENVSMGFSKRVMKEWGFKERGNVSMGSGV